MINKILLVSTPAPAIEQTEEETNYWKLHYSLKTILTYPNLSEKELLRLGNSENQNVGLLSIASYLRDNGIDVGYIAPSLEIIGDERDERFLDLLLKNIRETEPCFVGFSAHTCAIPMTIKYANEVKKINPNIRTVIGGAHANGSSQGTLEELTNNFDFVIRGKGELPLLKLLEGDIDFQGISYSRNVTPSSVTSPIYYTSPANDLLNVTLLPASRVFTSLGCRKGSQCVFCADIIHNKGFVTRPIEEILSEIQFFYKNFGTRYFYFGDENFFFDKFRALEIMDVINSLDLDRLLSYQVRLESADEDLIKKAAKSGKCTEIQYGVESASQKVLNMNKKGLRIQKVKDICDLTKSYGMATHCYFLVGLPGETQETARMTIEKMEELLKSRSVDFIEYRCAVPFHGSPMWELSKDYGINIKHKDWRLFRGRTNHHLI
ncbi:MAG: B12-binding domain-containing radical SAM protein [Nanoarchaeota archaeon]|nr:B12-binding domain-containing radical SAM protein [Nanoarchaeota archaeon]